MARIGEPDVVMHWPLTPPVHLEPIARGTNNRSWLVRSGAGLHVLKWYRNEDTPERLPFEHALLRALDAAGLPFGVPVPVPAKSGETSVELTDGTGTIRLALCQHLPGRPATFGSRSEAYRCGAALATLDQALASARLDPAVAIPGTYEGLASVHPRVPEPVDAIRALPGDPALADALARLLPRVEERWRERTSGWPTQLIHGDFYPSNAMVDAGEVSGILDFEHAGMGHRAIDVAIGLAAFSARDWDAGCAWPLLDAFAEGYLRRVPLSGEELAATPALLLMREASSLIHWLGRMRQGLTTLDDVRARGRRLLALHRWLEAHQHEMVGRLHRIAGG